MGKFCLVRELVAFYGEIVDIEDVFASRPYGLGFYFSGKKLLSLYFSLNKKYFALRNNHINPTLLINNILAQIVLKRSLIDTVLLPWSLPKEVTS